MKFRIPTAIFESDRARRFAGELMIIAISVKIRGEGNFRVFEIGGAAINDNEALKTEILRIASLCGIKEDAIKFQNA